MKTTFFSNLKKILTVQRIALLVAVCSLIVMLIVNWHNIFPKKTTVKDNIRQDITVINKQFNPEKWESMDSTMLYSNIADFERSVLIAADAWSKMDNMKPFSSMNEYEFRSSVSNYRELYREFGNARHNIINQTKLLFVSDLLYVMEDSNYVLNMGDIIDVNRLKFYNDLLTKQDSVFQKYVDDAMKKDNKKQMMKELDKMLNDDDFYEADECIFRIAIDIDNYVLGRLRKK